MRLFSISIIWLLFIFWKVDSQVNVNYVKALSSLHVQCKDHVLDIESFKSKAIELKINETEVDLQIRQCVFSESLRLIDIHQFLQQYVYANLTVLTRVFIIHSQLTKASHFEGLNQTKFLQIRELAGSPPYNLLQHLRNLENFELSSWHQKLPSLDLTYLNKLVVLFVRTKDILNVSKIVSEVPWVRDLSMVT